MARRADPEVPVATTGTDWTAQAADAIERAVGAVRDKTAVPMVTAARALVYGLLASMVGATVVVLLTIGLVRALDIVVPGPVWSAYLIGGGIFTLAGGFLLRRAGSGLHRAAREGGSR